MPQLDPTSFPSQLFWMTVSFVALYLVLARFLLPRVQSVILTRAHTIENDIHQASVMKTEAEQARQQYESALTEARAKSHAMLIEAQAALTAHAARQQAELDKALEKKLLESEASIRAAKQAVLDKLAPVSGELASLIVEVLVHHKPNSKEVGMVMNELAKGRPV